MTNFAPTNVSGILTCEEATATSSFAITGATAIRISNPDLATAVTVSFSLTEATDLASFPTNNVNGVGTVIPPYDNVVLSIPQMGNLGQLFLSVASAGGASVNVYYSLGTFV
jgi:hypothetical protein